MRWERGEWYATKVARLTKTADVLRWCSGRKALSLIIKCTRFKFDHLIRLDNTLVLSRFFPYHLPFIPHFVALCLCLWISFILPSFYTSFFNAFSCFLFFPCWTLFCPHSLPVARKSHIQESYQSIPEPKLWT